LPLLFLLLIAFILIVLYCSFFQEVLLEGLNLLLKECLEGLDFLILAFKAFLETLDLPLFILYTPFLTISFSSFGCGMLLIAELLFLLFELALQSQVVRLLFHQLFLGLQKNSVELLALGFQLLASFLSFIELRPQTAAVGACRLFWRFILRVSGILFRFCFLLVQKGSHHVLLWMGSLTYGKIRLAF